VDAIVVGYYRGDDLIYVARIRNGFVPASRRQIFARLKPLLTPQCPFANLPETHRGRWGEGLTAADHLRHAKFAGLRDDKDPQKVIKEHSNKG
jgi:bifunctional non-homologous end joining protein LigD